MRRYTGQRMVSASNKTQQVTNDLSGQYKDLEQIYQAKSLLCLRSELIVVKKEILNSLADFENRLKNRVEIGFKEGKYTINRTKKVKEYEKRMEEFLNKFQDCKLRIIQELDNN